MFLKLPRRLFRSFTVRLSLWYAAIFTLSAVVLFSLLYVLLAAALEHNDHEMIETRLRAYAAVYDNGGLAALQDFVERGREAEKNRSFFVRIAGLTGTVLLMNVPDDWVQFDAAALQSGGDLSHLVWTRKVTLPLHHCDCRTTRYSKSAAALETGSQSFSPFAETLWQ